MLWGFCSANNFGMRVNIIGLGNVLQLNVAISGDIQLIISLSDDSLASLIQLSAEGADELIKVYLAITVAVEMLKNLASLFLR